MATASGEAITASLDNAELIPSDRGGKAHTTRGGVGLLLPLRMGQQIPLGQGGFFCWQRRWIHLNLGIQCTWLRQGLPISSHPNFQNPILSQSMPHVNSRLPVSLSVQLVLELNQWQDEVSF